jgi:hypothetical protein
MAAGDVEVAVGVEPEIAVRVAANLDKGLAELFGLAGAGAATEGKGDLHFLSRK